MINPKDVDESLDEAQMVADEQKSVDLPEAPAVSNVKVWIKGYGVMLTVRGEKLMDMIKKTETIIDYAESHGWKNVWDTTPASVVGHFNSPTSPQGEVPLCGIHGTPMKWITGKYKTTTSYHDAGDDFAFWSCGKKNADDSYCNYKVPKAK